MNRRSLITGLASLIAAPAIVKANSLMPVRGTVMPMKMPFDAADIVFETASGSEPQRIRYCIVYNHDTGKIVYSGPVDYPAGGAII